MKKWGEIVSTKFSDLIDKENILLDRKRLADFNTGKRDEKYNLHEAMDRIMWEFLYERVHEVDIRDVLMVMEFVAEVNDKL